MNTSVVSHVGNEACGGARRSERWGFVVVRLVLGALLIMAAGLKFFDHSPDPTDRLGLLISPRWHMAAIEAEALLGIWLLTGALPQLLWLTALLGFALLASVSLYLGIEGQSSCGCLGAKLPVSPWYMFALDLAAIASLVWWRPAREHQTEVSHSATLRRVLMVAASLGAILAVAFSAGQSSPQLVPSEADLDMGQVPSGVQRQCDFWVTNRTARTVKVAEIETSCDCVKIDLPDRVLAPGEKVSGSIILDLREGSRLGGGLRVIAKGKGESGRVVFTMVVRATVMAY